MMMRINRILMGLFLTVLLSGCSSLSKKVGLDFTVDDLPEFAEQKTHYHEVLDALGPPTRLTATAGGFAFLYERIQIFELQAGVGGREGWLQLIKLSLANSRLHRDGLLLHFNEEGVLMSHALNSSDESLGAAGAIQPILSLQQLVDTKSYEDDAVEPLWWGGTLLKSGADALNTAQNLTTGMSGVEQSGTTTKAGQHTLEMR